MRVGILGGTFNPVHNAHLRIAEEAREAFQLERVVFIPADTPPHKQRRVGLSFEVRCEMVRLAVADNSAFAVSDIEKARGCCYSVDTLRHLRDEFPGDELFFIIGGDSFVDICTWRDYADIFTLCNVVAVQRPGSTFESLTEALPVAIAKEFCYKGTPKTLMHASGFGLFALDGVLLDISSSHIRSLVKSGRSIRYLVPEAVERYIKEQRLYIDVS